MVQVKFQPVDFPIFPNNLHASIKQGTNNLSTVSSFQNFPIYTKLGFTLTSELDKKQPSYCFMYFLHAALCRLRNLKRLDLSYNFLDDGSVPSCLFEKHSLLESLDISHNNIRGSPGFFSGNAEIFKISFNSFTFSSMMKWNSLSRHQHQHVFSIYETWFSVRFMIF